MNVSLTPELEKYVKDKVATGRYTSASEVIREALRDSQEREEYQEYLKRELQKGIDSLDRGDWIDGEAFFEELRNRYKPVEAK
jgi:antitoxin ParD1/3/4